MISEAKTPYDYAVNTAMVLVDCIMIKDAALAEMRHANHLLDNSDGGEPMKELYKEQDRVSERLDSAWEKVKLAEAQAIKARTVYEESIKTQGDFSI